MNSKYPAEIKCPHCGGLAHKIENKAYFCQDCECEVNYYGETVRIFRYSNIGMKVPVTE